MEYSSTCNLKNTYAVERVVDKKKQISRLRMNLN